MDNHYNCIYMYINVINNRKYVGQAKDFNIRHKQHIRESSNKTPIDRAFNKYGEENFEIVILKENIYTQCLLNLWESYYINKYNCLSKENYNISDGGYNGNPFAGKTEEEMKEIRQKMSEAHKGENHPMYGRKHSEKSKQKMSETHKGKNHSEEWKQKMSEAHKGKNNPMYGNHHSEESKQKMSEAVKGKNHPRAKRVAQYDLNGNLIKIWDYAKQAEEELGINHCNISMCCKCKRKSAGGFIWKYYKGDD